MESGKEVDVEAEKQLLARHVQEWFEAENRKDVDGVMKFIAEDYILQPPNMPQIVGREAYRKFLVEFLQSFEIRGVVSVSGVPTRIEVSAAGDLAYYIGTSRAVLKGPEGRAREGKYLLVWKKIDGEWKCVAESFSSDKPRSEL